MAINYPVAFNVDKSGLKKGVGALKNFGKQAARIGAAAGAAIGGAATFSVKQFTDFDAALNKSISIMGDVSDTLKNEMGEAAKEVAKQTSFSASEAAEAYFFLASAGLDAEQQISAMPQVAAFAQAGMFDMATATDLATDAQSALGLASDDNETNLENLTRVTDVFVKANTLANTSVEQLAAAMTQKAGNALKTVGKDIEEGSAALAVFADQGIKGERAGTLLTNTIFGLTEKAQANKGAFEELGIEVFDAEGNMRNFSDISGDVTTAFAGMTEEAKLAAIDQLGFNKQAREGILALEGNSEKLAEYEESLRDAGGTAQDVAENQMDTFAGKMDKLRSNVEVAAIEVGEELVPYLSDLVEGLIPLIEEHLPTVVGFFEDLASNVSDLADEFQPHIDEVLPTISGLFEDFEEPLDNVNSFLRTIGEETLETVKNIMEDERFQEGVRKLGENVGELAVEAERFVESEIGEALQYIGQEFIIRGINGLASGVGFLADRLEDLNNAQEAFGQGNFVQGIRDLDNLFANLFLNQGLRDFFGYNEPEMTGSGSPAGEFPNFADGGIVKARPGGLIGRIGEAGRDEAVIPLDRAGNLMAGGGGNTINITVNAGMGSDPVSVGREVVNAIKRYENTNGKVFASV